MITCAGINNYRKEKTKKHPASRNLNGDEP